MLDYIDAKVRYKEYNRNVHAHLLEREALQATREKATARFIMQAYQQVWGWIFDHKRDKDGHSTDTLIRITG
jgi:hypothetical protein